MGEKSQLAVQGEKKQLYLRSMDRLEATPIPGTEGAVTPFFSPDGEWLGFHANGKLKKVSLQGGQPITIGDGNHRGASWGETFWCDDEFEQKLDEARTALDFEARKAIYQRAQELQSTEGGEIIPFFVNNIRIFNARLEGAGASYQFSNMPYYLWSISE